ncbi:MAG: hypothetical protein ACNFW9_04155 [Candidatus Kerfeldbacteria bacterium]
MIKNIIKNTWLGFIEVLRRPKYIILTIIIFILMMIFFIYSPIYKFLWEVLTNNVYDFGEKIKVFYYSLGSIGSNFSASSRIIAIVIALFTSINLSMLVYYLKVRIKNERASGAGLIGTVIGVLGVGCASCGSVLLTSIFGISSTSALIGFLPFNGVEFGLIGMIFILFAIYLLAKKIINPNVCKINTK